MTRGRRRSRRSLRLADVGEHGFLSKLCARIGGGRDVEVGPGDDAAVVRVGGRRWILTTDALVEDVHFRRGWDRPEGLGRRAFAVNASDVAAMGGEPRFALLSLSLPQDTPVAELEAFVRGFERAARENGCALVGGNLTASPRWMVSATVIGEAVSPPLLRSGARPGDGVWVSGSPGRAALARELLLGGRRVDARRTRAWRRPVPRVALGRALARARIAGAAIDVSDGLLQDLGHVCRASGVGAVVETARLPLAAPLRRLGRSRALGLALSGGEDYELLFTVPARHESRVPALAARARTGARRIGRIVRAPGIELLDAAGRRVPPPSPGYDHFARGTRGESVR